MKPRESELLHAEEDHPMDTERTLYLHGVFMGMAMNHPDRDQALAMVEEVFAAITPVIVPALAGDE